MPVHLPVCDGAIDYLSKLNARAKLTHIHSHTEEIEKKKQSSKNFSTLKRNVRELNKG